MDMYANAVRPVLFRLSADKAHDLVHVGLRVKWPWRLLGRSARTTDPRLSTEVAGIGLENPIGLAPGFDKDGQLVPALDRLGFGYLIVGSITSLPRPGNAKPRLVRYPDTLSIGNSMGLPSRGLAEAVRLLSSAQPERSKLMASVAGFTSEELLDAAAAVEPHVSAVEIGLICPNTTESERMEELAIFTRLAEGLADQKSKPIFIKLPPHHDDIDRERVFRMLDVILRVGIEGVSVSGSRTIDEPRLSTGRGTIAGRDTYADSLRIVKDVSQHTNRQLAIKASGGVFDGGHAAEMLGAGAATVEVYSSFIYRGWATAGLLNRELIEIINAEGLHSIADLRPGTWTTVERADGAAS